MIESVSPATKTSKDLYRNELWIVLIIIISVLEHVFNVLCIKSLIAVETWNNFIANDQ